MDALAHHLLTQAYNNAWANHRLLNACAQLSQAEFEAPRTGFFPSIRATLNHNLTVDWFCRASSTNPKSRVRPVPRCMPNSPSATSV
jgi:uncharacterized damage-inducible protein DinB